MKIFKIVLTVIQAVVSIWFFYSAVSLNILSGKWIAIIGAVLVLFLLLSIISIIKNVKGVIRRLAIIFAILIVINCGTASFGVQKFKSFFDGKAVSKTLGIDAVKAEKGEPYFVYLDISGSSGDLDDDASVKEKVADNIANKLFDTSEVIALINPETNQILTITTRVDEAMEPDETIEYLEKLYGITINYFARLDSEGLEDTVEEALDDLDIDDIDTENLDAATITNTISDVVFKNAGALIGAIGDTFITNMPVTNVTALAKQALTTEEIAISSFSVGHEFMDKDEPVLVIRKSEVKQAKNLIKKLLKGEVITEKDTKDNVDTSVSLDKITDKVN